MSRSPLQIQREYQAREAGAMALDLAIANKGIAYIVDTPGGGVVAVLPADVPEGSLLLATVTTTGMASVILPRFS
jgi:hypothetical protein